MTPELKALIGELGEAINESLSDSEAIAEVVSKIKASGYDIFLVMEATIGFNKTKTAAKISAKTTALKLTAQDRRFLKSYHIADK